MATDKPDSRYRENSQPPKKKPKQENMKDIARDSLEDFQSSIFDISDGNQLVDFIRKKKGLRSQPLNIFTDIQPDRKSLQIEIRRLDKDAIVPDEQENEDEKTLQPLEDELPDNFPNILSGNVQPASTSNAEIVSPTSRRRTLAKSPFIDSKIKLKRLSHTIGRRTLLKEFEKTLQESNFLPETCSTPLSQDVALPAISPSNVDHEQTLTNNLNLVCSPITVTDTDSASPTANSKRQPEEIHSLTTNGNSEYLMCDLQQQNDMLLELNKSVEEHEQNKEEENISPNGLNKLPMSPQHRTFTQQELGKRLTFTVQRDITTGRLLLTPDPLRDTSVRQPSSPKTPNKSVQPNLNRLIVTPKQKRLLQEKFHCTSIQNVPTTPQRVPTSVHKTSRIPVIMRGMGLPGPPPPQPSCESPQPSTVTTPHVAQSQETTQTQQIIEQLQKGNPSNAPVIVIPVNQTFNQVPPIGKPLTRASICTSSPNSNEISSTTTITTAKPIESNLVEARSDSTNSDDRIPMNSLRLEDIITEDDESACDDPTAAHTKTIRTSLRSTRLQTSRQQRVKNKRSLIRQVSPPLRNSLRNVRKLVTSEELAAMNVGEVLDLRKRYSSGESRRFMTKRESNLLDKQLENELLRRSIPQNNYENEAIGIDEVPSPPLEFCDVRNTLKGNTVLPCDLDNEKDSDRISLSQEKAHENQVSKRKLRQKKKIAENVERYLEASKIISKSKLRYLNMSKRKLYSKGISDLSSDDSSPEKSFSKSRSNRRANVIHNECERLTEPPAEFAVSQEVETPLSPPQQFCASPALTNKSARTSCYLRGSKQMPISALPLPSSPHKSPVRTRNRLSVRTTLARNSSAVIGSEQRHITPPPHIPASPPPSPYGSPVRTSPLLRSNGKNSSPQYRSPVKAHPPLRQKSTATTPPPSPRQMSPIICPPPPRHGSKFINSPHRDEDTSSQSFPVLTHCSPASRVPHPPPPMEFANKSINTENQFVPIEQDVFKVPIGVPPKSKKTTNKSLNKAKKNNKSTNQKPESGDFPVEPNNCSTAPSNDSTSTLRRSGRDKKPLTAYWSCSQTEFRPLFDYNVIYKKRCNNSYAKKAPAKTMGRPKKTDNTLISENTNLVANTGNKRNVGRPKKANIIPSGDNTNLVANTKPTESSSVEKAKSGKVKLTKNQSTENEAFLSRQKQQQQYGTDSTSTSSHCPSFHSSISSSEPRTKAQVPTAIPITSEDSNGSNRSGDSEERKSRIAIDYSEQLHHKSKSEASSTNKSKGAKSKKAREPLKSKRKQQPSTDSQSSCNESDVPPPLANSTVDNLQTNRITSNLKKSSKSKGLVPKSKTTLSPFSSEDDSDVPHKVKSATKNSESTSRQLSSSSCDESTGGHSSSIQQVRLAAQSEYSIPELYDNVTITASERAYGKQQQSNPKKSIKSKAILTSSENASDDDSDVRRKLTSRKTSSKSKSKQHHTSSSDHASNDCPTDEHTSSIQQIRLATIAEDSIPDVNDDVTVTVGEKPPESSRSKVMAPSKRQQKQSHAVTSKKFAYRTEHDESIADVSSLHVNSLFDQLKSTSMCVATGAAALQISSSGQVSHNSRQKDRNAAALPKFKNLTVRLKRMKNKKTTTTTKVNEKVSDSGFSSEDVSSVTKQNGDLLLNWLKEMISKKSPSSATKGVARFLQADGFHAASADDLVFQELNGVDYAFYDTKEQFSFGYMRFNPKSFKKKSSAKKFELNLLVLGGSLKIVVNHNMFDCSPGDLITVFIGTSYGIHNNSNEPALVMVIKK